MKLLVTRAAPVFALHGGTAAAAVLENPQEHSNTTAKLSTPGLHTTKPQ